MRLIPDQTGQLVGRIARRVDAVAPSTYDYGELNPYRERPFVMGRLIGGFGEAVQRTATPTRYKTATNADLSIDGQRRIGPAFRFEAMPGLPPPTFAGQNDVRQFVVGPGESTPVLYCLVRDQVFRRTPATGTEDPPSGTWTLSHDFGPNAGPQQAVWFQGRAGSPGLFVATKIAQLWKYDGVTWQQATPPAGVLAEFVAFVGQELYVASGNALHVLTDGDPLTDTTHWGGAILVGDSRTRITGLAALDSTIVVFKEEGVYTLNADASDNDLVPEFRGTPSIQTGRNAVAWRDHLWFQTGRGYYRMDSSATFEPIGPERVTEHGAGCPGRVVSGAGHRDWFLYAVVYDDAENRSCLLKYGTWVNEPDGSGQYRFNDSWHGSLCEWASRRATRVDVVQFDTDLWGTSLPGPALFVGFADGSVAWTPLPSGSPDPAADPDCRYTLEESTVDWPDHVALAWADVKRWRAVAATGARIDATCYATIQLRYDDDAAWTDVPTPLTVAGLAVLTPYPSASRMVRVREVLHGTAHLTPEIDSVVLHEQVRPALQIEYAATAVAGNRTPRLDGTIDPRTAEQVRRALQATAGPGPTTVRFPDRTAQDVDFVDYGEALPGPSQRWGVEWRVPVTFIQWRSNTTYGSWRRVAAHTWRDVSRYAWRQVQSL